MELLCCSHRCSQRKPVPTIWRLVGRRLAVLQLLVPPACMPRSAPTGCGARHLQLGPAHSGAALTGLMRLHDSTTGDLLAILHSGWLTAVRTGAGAALGAHVPAPTEAHNVGIISAPDSRPSLNCGHNRTVRTRPNRRAPSGRAAKSRLRRRSGMSWQAVNGGNRRDSSASPRALGPFAVAHWLVVRAAIPVPGIKRYQEGGLTWGSAWRTRRAPVRPSVRFPRIGTSATVSAGWCDGRPGST